MKFLLLYMLLLIPKRVLTNELPSSMLSAVSSSETFDDVVQALFFTTSRTAEASAFGPDILIKPKIISVHSSVDVSKTTNSWIINSATTSFSTSNPTATNSTTSPSSTATQSVTNSATSKVSATSKQTTDPSITIPPPVTRLTTRPPTISEPLGGPSTAFHEANTIQTKRQPQTTSLAATVDATQQLTSRNGITDFDLLLEQKSLADGLGSTMGQSVTTAVALATTATSDRSQEEISTEAKTTILISSQSTHNISDPPKHAGGASEPPSNSSTSQDLVLLYTVAKFLAYLRENTDRILVVVLGSLCVGLFLTLIFLACRCDRKDSCSLFQRDKRKQASTGEGASLMGTSHLSPNESISINPGNMLSGQPFQTPNHHQSNHIDYIDRAQGRFRKKRSKTHILLKKWCSCCCTNAPWQRDPLDSETSYRFAPASTSLSDEDIISAVVSTRDQFEGPLPVFPRLSQPEEAANDNCLPRSITTDPRIDHVGGDNRSEYEFTDNGNSPPSTRGATNPPPPSLQNTFSLKPASTQGNQQTVQSNDEMHSALPITHSAHRASVRRQPSFSSPKRKRDLPPFPKPLNFGHNFPSEQNVPHYATHRGSSPEQRQERNPFNAISNNVSQQRHHHVQIPNTGDHYVSLQPQQHHPNTARTLNLGRTNGRLERRDSFYDNSLPRDSPIYEYYQRRQAGRQELPGTKNINQYYS